MKQQRVFKSEKMREMMKVDFGKDSWKSLNMDFESNLIKITTTPRWREKISNDEETPTSYRRFEFNIYCDWGRIL